MTGLVQRFGGSSGEAYVVPVRGASPPDIIELIMADHRRIGRLRGTLYDTTRHDGDHRPDWMLGHVWPRLADLLVAHTHAEEEICYLPLLGCGPQAAGRMRDSVAEHDDIRRVISDASLLLVGSAPWWRAVSIVLAVSAEHLEREERDILPDCLSGLTMRRRKELGRQWCAFIAAWRGPPCPSQPRQLP
jgi:Hemerythrin HHE cation binding domain